MVILRDVRIAPAWQGHGFGGVLVAGALRALAPGARLAACRVSPLDFARVAPDRVSAELASVRMAAMLERIGFRRWRDMHVVDVKSPLLLDARLEVVQRCYPENDHDGD